MNTERSSVHANKSSWLLIECLLSLGERHNQVILYCFFYDTYNFTLVHLAAMWPHVTGLLQEPKDLTRLATVIRIVSIPTVFAQGFATTSEAHHI